MSFIGDIVEHEVAPPSEPVQQREATGFPKRGGAANPSRWKLQPREGNVERAAPPKASLEADKIHRENMAKISAMTEGEIAEERAELLQNLDPGLVQSLLKRVDRRVQQEASGAYGHVEGSEDGWIGGDREGRPLPKLDESDVNEALGVQPPSTKLVRFGADVVAESGWEDVDDLNDMMGAEEVAEDGYQLVQPDEERSTVHFPKPPAQPDLDLDDPQFYDKLHEKYYPDLPKETNKLSWMTTPVPQVRTTTYESISDMRFDFKGNLVDLPENEVENASETPTYLGLHHHSDNPHLAGYTLPELAHLARSVVPSQRCVAIQILGRILHKLGLHKFLVGGAESETSNADFDESVRDMAQTLEEMMWDLVGQLRIIETLTEAADEQKTKNLSVRNYAIEALWLWRQGNQNDKIE